MQELKLVTVDVWDTLIRRRCDPDAVKVHVCRFLLLTHHEIIKEKYRDITALLHARQAAEGAIGMSQKASGFDDEYGIREVYSYWLQTVLSTFHEPIVEALFQCELDQEYLVTYKDPSIESTLNKFANAKLVFVSDFYMSAQTLKSLLKHVKLDQVIHDGYSSCDVLLNKRSGRIFPYVLEREQQEAKYTLHIGDNENSDVRSPKKFGINTLHYMPTEQHSLRERLAYEHRNPGSKIKNIISSLLAEQPDRNSIFSSGIKYSSLVVGFMLQIMESAIKNKQNRVFFFTREGEFFKRVYDAIASQEPFGVAVPEAVVLEVSRIATFAPSLQAISIQSLMRIWSLYSTQSIGALFSSLDIDIEQFSSVLLQYDLNIEEQIQYPWLDQRVISLFDNNEFKSKIDSILRSKRTLILGYLKSKNFPFEGKASIVDIGWRGTIQDNLAHIFPDLQIDGYYLALDKFINKQPLNTRKTGYVSDLNNADFRNAYIFQKVSPIEMLCNSPNGSVVGYREEDEKFTAIRLVHESENRSFYDAVTHFQQGVIETSIELGKAVRIHSLHSEDFKTIALTNWSEIIDSPSSAIANAYFKLAHNESFGLGRFDDKTSVIPYSLWLKSLISVRSAKILVQRLEQTGWPEGYLAQRKLGWVWALIDLARKMKKKLY